MGEVKTAFEKAMEKMNVIEDLSKEEKDEMKDREKLRSLLAAFYRGNLNRDETWENFRKFSPSLLKEAQQNMADSLRLLNAPEEFRQRKDGILAIEAIKKRQNTASIENTMNFIDTLQREFQDGKQRAVEELRRAIEANPQLRVRPVRTPDGRTVLQAIPSVDEAVQERLGDFLAEHERRYETQFMQAVARLKKELN